MKYILLSLTFLLAGTAAAATIAPASYSISPAGYPDETGIQLTDGATVVSFFPVEGGDPFPMVGWGSASTAFLEFSFSGSHSFGNIDLHLSDGDGAAGIDLPQTVSITIGQTTLQFAPAADDLPGTLNRWYSFNVGGLTGNAVSIALVHPNTEWVFADEVVFNAAEEAPGVPEPGTMLLAGAGAALLMIRRLRFKA